MKEEKFEGVDPHTFIHKNHGGLLVVIGVIAILYGVINYLRVTINYAWPPYTGWVIGGLILIILGLIRGHWGRHH